MHVCNWLPGLVPCSNWAEFEEYEKILYSIFSNDFIQTRPLYENKDVVIRKYPLRNGHEEAFYHLTSKEYRSDMERQPDPNAFVGFELLSKTINAILLSVKSVKE
mgnify:CR=1 FL=1